MMYFTRSLAVLAVVFASISTITALPTPGDDGTAQDFCVFKREDGGETAVAC
jgi:hypothetical protein